MNIKMLVATHKMADVPFDDFYLPVHVGHALADSTLGFQPDDDGENISAKNPSYCELTALYWAWKNLSADAIGLSHYRRYFIGTQLGPNQSRILSQEDVDQLLTSADVVVGRPRNYVVETVESHYRNGHHGRDLTVLRRAVQGLSPQVLPHYDEVFRGRKLSLYNMLIMKQPEFSRYCEWLFAVLGQAESEIDNSPRTAYQRRTFGYLAERLLNVWVHYRGEQLTIAYRRIINTEGENKTLKAARLLSRKLVAGGQRRP